MFSSIADLVRSLSQSKGAANDSPDGIAELAKALSRRPVPVGRLRRMKIVASVHAKVAAAYLFHWVRGWVKSPDEQARSLADVNMQSAQRLLESMQYLRGAMMKVGQTLASLPDIAPREVVETLQSLHFNAPPMHWSLMREMVFSELGDDPEELFAEFDTTAFAAASLGQVHRARLKTGEEVAVKLQYPGIARTIRDDFRNLSMLLLPARLGGQDLASTRAQFDALRAQIEQETDYEREARCLTKARSLFNDGDGIVVPRVYREFTTSRVLTMEYVRGPHLAAYLDSGPTQLERNRFGARVFTAWYRLLYAGRMLYADFHPGNLVFLEDGRLGVLDFGFVRQFSNDEWEWFRKSDRAVTTGDPADIRETVREGCQITELETDQDRLQCAQEFARAIYEPRCCGVEFDFGDGDYFRRCCELLVELAGKRYTQGRPFTPISTRQDMGYRSILYRLRAKVNVRELAEREVQSAGWDRSAYAPGVRV